MTKLAFFKTGALGALVTALLASALPAQAQTWSRGGGHGHNAGARGQVREDRAQSPRQSRPAAERARRLGRRTRPGARIGA